MWPEHVASRGADEVGSCLLKAIPTMLRDKRKLIVWSDSCSGQNKNFKVMCLFTRAVMKGKRVLRKSEIEAVLSMEEALK